MCSYLAMSKEASKCVGSLASTSSCTVCMAMLIKKVSDNSCEDVIYLYFVRVCVKNKLDKTELPCAVKLRKP